MISDPEINQMNQGTIIIANQLFYNLVTRKNSLSKNEEKKILKNQQNSLHFKTLKQRK